MIVDDCIQWSCAHPIAEMARWLECDACSTYNSQRTTFIPHTTDAPWWFQSQGWLAGSSSTLAPGAVLPTIAIVAHHDSYGAAPVRISAQYEWTLQCVPATCAQATVTRRRNAA